MRALLLWCLFLIALPAPAGQVEGLYSAQAAVAGRDPDSRNAALREALKKVLVKLTGRRTTEAPQALLDQAPDWVETFRYRDTRDPEHPMALEVQFDPRALNRALRAQGIPLWGPDRPLVLLWAAEERHGRRHLLQNDTDAQVFAALEAAAADRGLPLLLPLNDLEDRQHLQAGDLWGGFDERIERASQRYRPDLVMVALARIRPSGARVQWRLTGSEDQGTARAQALDTAMAQALDQAADAIAAHYLTPVAAPGAGNATTPGLRLELTGVTDLDDLHRFAAFLDGRRAVTHWALEAVEDDRAWFRLRVAGGRDALTRLPGLRRLADPEAPAQDEAPPPDLCLRLRP